VEVEDHGPQHQHEGEEAEVGTELRHVLGDRDHLELEAQQPGGEEGGEIRRQIGEEVEAGRLTVAFLNQRRESLSSENDETTVTGGARGNEPRKKFPPDPVDPTH